MKKQFVAKLIVLGMVLAMLPVSAMAAQQRAITWDDNGIYTDSATGDVWWFDENGNQIELKDDDEDNYQPGRFREDDYDRYQDVGSESEFADAGFTMKESSDDDDLAAAEDETDAGDEDSYGDED